MVTVTVWVEGRSKASFQAVSRSSHWPFALRARNWFFATSQTMPNLTQKTCSMNIDQLLHVSSKSDCFSFVNFLDKTGRFMWLLSLIYCESGHGLADNRNRLADILPSKDIQTILNTVRLRSKRMCWLVATSYYCTTHITAQNGFSYFGIPSPSHTSHIKIAGHP